jgi:hypothetical protein
MPREGFRRGGVLQPAPGLLRGVGHPVLLQLLVGDLEGPGRKRLLPLGGQLALELENL